MNRPGTGYPAAMKRDAEDLIVTLKRVAGTLKGADIPFALGGGFAVYARGGPASEHDVDLFLRPADVERALSTLAEAGFETERPPEDWLVKVWDADRLVDLIFRPSEREVTDEMLARAEEMSVHALLMPVLSATDVLVMKLLVLNEHYCDLTTVLPVARALREQVDWEQLRSETKQSPFAEAFLLLVERLGVAPGPSRPMAGAGALGAGSGEGDR